MYTMLKGASTGFHHLEILSVGEVCIKNGHAVCQDVICRVRYLFQEIESDSEKLLTVVTGVANSLF